jgi:hypothetical protein
MSMHVCWNRGRGRTDNHFVAKNGRRDATRSPLGKGVSIGTYSRAHKLRSLTFLLQTAILTEKKMKGKKKKKNSFSLR